MLSRSHLTHDPIALPDRDVLDDAEALAMAEAAHAELRIRHSVRDVADRPVPRKIIETCIGAAGTAPSSANRQPWHCVAIADPALKARIRDGANAEGPRIYGGIAGDGSLRALEPIGSGAWRSHKATAPGATVLAIAKVKKPLNEIMMVRG